MIRYVVQAVDLELDLDGFGESFAARVGSLDTTGLHEEIGEYMVGEAVPERFETETAPDGTPWQPLSPATLVSQYQGRGRGRKTTKRGRGGEVETAGFARFRGRKKILQDMGRRGGLLGQVAYRAEDGRVSIGSNKVYARIHQLGGEAGRGVTIPARPYLGLSDANRSVVSGIVRAWVRDALG